MNELEIKYKILFGGYLGVSLMDEYSSKEYVLYDIENYIKGFIEINPLPNFNYSEYMNKVDMEESNKVKLQDALRVLNIINGSTELKYLIKKKIREINNEERYK